MRAHVTSAFETARIVLLLLVAAGCEADLSNHVFSCHDGHCPEGLTCSSDFVCEAPNMSGGVSEGRDAEAPDTGTASDAAIDPGNSDASVPVAGAGAGGASGGGDPAGEGAGGASGVEGIAGASGDAGGAAGTAGTSGAGGGAGSAGENAAGQAGASGAAGMPTGCTAANAECRSGEQQNEQRPCGNCGMQSRQRTCTATTCRWEWSNWSACSQPADACAPGALRTGSRACGKCNSGTQPTQQTCSEKCQWGQAIETRACSGETAACAPGAMETQSEACGACGKGTRTRTRTCTNQCSWGTPGAWSACSAVMVECMPGAPAQTQSLACTTCGSKNQSRSCNANTCTWGAWTDTSRCTTCAACSQVVYCDTPDDVAPNRGTWCKQQACSAQQAIDHCDEILQNIGCTRHEPFFFEPL